jgi:DNA replication initiation complex subunit (GINS family)
MAENSITFETIRKIQIEEKTLSKLAKLPENFYNNVSRYLEQKRRIGEGRKDNEIKNLERIIEDIFNRRERKIVLSALLSARTNIPPENLTDEEEKFFESIMQIIKSRRENILNKILKSPEDKLMVKVVFKKDVDEFVGSDLKTYGPFKANDVAEIPEENFKIFLDMGIVEEVRM